MINIDGSSYEGGGAIVRVSGALSVITGKSFELNNIRKNRPKGGLKNQHVAGLKSLEEIFDSRCNDCFQGSSKIIFRPGKLKKNSAEIKIDTAGSVGLVLQTLQYPIINSGTNFNISIKGGGSFGKWAPPLDYLENILFKIFEKFGARVSIEILKHGFYPKGGAITKVNFEGSNLNGINLTDFGKISKVSCISVADNSLKKSKVADRQAEAFGKFMNKKGIEFEKEIIYTNSECPGSGIVGIAETDSGCFIGSDRVGEIKKSSEFLGKECAMDLYEEINSKATVDIHASDQLLTLMAICDEKSEINVKEITMHAKTNIWLIKKFMGINFKIVKNNENFTIKKNMIKF